MSIIGLIKIIVSHPIYKIIKKVINVLIIFEGMLLVIYYFELPTSNLGYLNIIFTTIYLYSQEIYINILKYIRYKLNYLLDENIETIINTENNETNNKEYDNKTYNYLWWIGITTVIIISGITIYYYYPNILEYFKDNNLKPSDDENTSLIDSPDIEIRYHPIIPENSNINYCDEPLDLSCMNTPKASITELGNNETTPKASTSILPSVENKTDYSVYDRPKDRQPLVFLIQNLKKTFLKQFLIIKYFKAPPNIKYISKHLIGFEPINFVSKTNAIPFS